MANDNISTVVIIAFIIYFAFSILMILDCNSFKTGPKSGQIVWLFAMLLFCFPTSIIYFFCHYLPDRQRRSRERKKEDLDYKISSLKVRAMNKNIARTCTAVVQKLGSQRCFEDSLLKIEISNSKSVKATLKASNQVVFEASYTKPYSYSTGTVLKPIDEGGYELKSEYAEGGDSYYIDSYIVGDWEKHLKSLYSRVLREEASNEVGNEGKADEEKRKKFGL